MPRYMPASLPIVPRLAHPEDSESVTLRALGSPHLCAASSHANEPAAARSCRVLAVPFHVLVLVLRVAPVSDPAWPILFPYETMGGSAPSIDCAESKSTVISTSLSSVTTAASIGMSHSRRSSGLRHAVVRPTIGRSSAVKIHGGGRVLGAKVKRRESGSHRTRRWREVDSNPRSPVGETRDAGTG
jgi:hypothetical protein